MVTDHEPFTDRLLDRLLDEHATLTAPAAREPSRARPGSSWARRRRPILLLGTPLVLGVAAAAVVLGRHPQPVPAPHHHHHHAAPVPGAGGHALASTGGGGGLPAHVTVSYVVHRMGVAAAENDAVVHELDRAPDSQTGAPTRIEGWSQHGNDTSLSITLDAQGHPVSGTLLTQAPSQTTSTTFDYRTRTYATRTYSPGPAGGPGPAPQTLGGAAATLRRQVAEGQWRLLGPATVDGVRTLQLQRSVHGTIEQTYVDPDTYLDVRDVYRPAGASPSSPQTITDDYQYLPNTAANRAHLTLRGAIPPGFHRAG
jgi:hypothetical protein